MILIPYPQKITESQGIFHISGMTEIFLDISCDYTDFEAAVVLQSEIASKTGLKLAITKGKHTRSLETADMSAGLIILEKSGETDTHASASAGKKVSGGTGSSSDAKSLGSTHQSYKLTSNEKTIIIRGSGTSGLYYGIQTLRQLIRSFASSIPCLEIEDQPCLENRGFYHDTTRGKVPTLETLKELADRLSFYKLNQLQLYIEHSFAFHRHSEIWIDSDPLTAEEILILDEYCKKRCVELVPSLSTFGHLYHALISKSFSHLNEYEDIPEKPFLWTDRMAHYTLDASDPQSLGFVREMIDEYIPLFSSDKFNICCDETFDLGRGKNSALAEEIGKGKLYLFFVRSLTEHMKNHKKKVMMWGDILLKYPEIINDIPQNVTILNWDYSPEAAEDGFRQISESGLRQYVCPGVHGWNKLLNDFDIAAKNIDILTGYAQKYNAAGMLNTDWGDFGHINLLAGSIPLVVYGAGLSWNTGRQGQPTDEEISKMEYGDASGKLISLVRQLSQQPVMDWYDVVLWYYASAGYDAGSYGSPGHISEKLLNYSDTTAKAAYDRIGQLKDEISSLQQHIYDNRKSDVTEFVCAAEGLELFQALLLVLKKKFLGQSTVSLIFSPAELAVKLEYWFSRYKILWRMRNKESELFRIKDVIMGICSLLRSK